MKVGRGKERGSEEGKNTSERIGWKRKLEGKERTAPVKKQGNREKE